MDNNKIPQEVYDYLYAERPKKAEFQPGDFTSQIAAEVWELSKEGARRILNTMVDEGKLEKLKSGSTYIYRPIAKIGDL